MNAQELRVTIRKLRDIAPGTGVSVAHEIGRSGEDGVRTIIQFLEDEGENHVVRNHAFEALKHLGPSTRGPIITYVEEFDNFHDYTKVYIVKGLIKILGSGNGQTTEETLLSLLERLNQELDRDIDSRSRHNLLSVKVEIHELLAGMGSRRATADLMTLLGDGRDWVSPSILQSLGKIGDSRSLVPLVRLHARQQENAWYAREIRKAFRAIIRREGLSAADLEQTVDLDSGERASLLKLLSARNSQRLHGGAQ